VQPLELPTSNLVNNLGLGLAYRKQRLRPKLSGVWVRGAFRKIWNPLLISATVEASNFKFGIQLGFGTSIPKKQRLGPKLAAVWASGHPKKIGARYLFLQPLKLATEKLVHNISSGLPCQTQTLGRVWVKRLPLPSPLWWWCNCVFYVPSKTEGYSD